MKFIDLFNKVQMKTDIDVICNETRLTKIKYDTYYEDIPIDIRQAAVDYVTAIDGRTIEVGITKVSL